MCGIAAIISKKGKPNRMALMKMMDSLSNRGNGQKGIYQKDNVGLVHQRLHLVGDKSGAQPMENKRLVIVANAEIYNWKELKKDLDYDFKTNSDIEVLLAGLTLEGQDFLNKIEGDFAFVAYDKVHKKIVAYKDRFGIRQLFIRDEPEAVYLASDIKTLLSIKPPEISLKEHHINYRIPVSCEKPYKNVWNLNPGCKVTFKKSLSFYSEIERWYDMPDKPVKFKGKEFIDKLSKVSNLMNHDNAGLCLSGGIDSQLLASVLPPMDCYTLEGGEEQKAKELCEKYGHSYIVVKIPEITEQLVEKILNVQEIPFYSLSPNYFIAEQASKDGKKVLLTGLGPDEMCGGYYYPDEKTVETWRNFHTLFGDELKPGKEDYRKFRLLEMTYYIGHHHTWRTDQMFMNFGIEGRHPYLSKEIAEYLFNCNLKDKTELWALGMGEPYKKGLSINMSKVVENDIYKWVKDNIKALPEGFPKPENYKQKFYLAALSWWIKKHERKRSKLASLRMV